MLKFFSRFSQKKKSSSNSPTKKAKKIINTFKEKGVDENVVEKNLEKMRETGKSIFTRRPKKNSSSRKKSSKRNSLSSDKKQKIKQIEENFKGTLHGHLDKVVDINKLEDAIDSVKKKTDIFRRPKKEEEDEIVISVKNLDTGKVSKSIPVYRGGRKTRKMRR